LRTGSITENTIDIPAVSATLTDTVAAVIDAVT
jgi:hypothetical protein